MNLNATLFAQIVVFFILAWFTMKFVWPPIMKALDERATKIAEGLAAAERGSDASDGAVQEAATDGAAAAAADKDKLAWTFVNGPSVGFRNGGFRNGGFYNGGFRNGGFYNGGFRNGGFRNGGGWRNGGFLNRW